MKVGCKVETPYGTGVINNVHNDGQVDVKVEEDAGSNTYCRIPADDVREIDDDTGD